MTVSSVASLPSPLTRLIFVCTGWALFWVSHKTYRVGAKTHFVDAREELFNGEGSKGRKERCVLRGGGWGLTAGSLRACISKIGFGLEREFWRVPEHKKTPLGKTGPQTYTVRVESHAVCGVAK